MRAMHEAMLTEDTVGMVDQHLKLVAAIGKKDVDGARALMAVHVDATRRRLLEA